MERFERSVQALLATGNRLLSDPFKLKLLMIILEKFVRAATHTPIDLSHQTLHGELTIVADRSDHSDCNTPLAIFSRFSQELMRSTDPAKPHVAQASRP